MTGSSEYQARITRQRRAAGLCVDCGKRKAARARVRCVPCLRRACEAQAIRRAEARGKGRCYICGDHVRIPVLCDRCEREKHVRAAEPSPRPARAQAKAAVGTLVRTRQLGHVLASVILLRTGRWTIAEWSAEIGVHWRTTYRLVTALRRAGIVVEVSREREHDRGPATPLYSIPGEPIRKLLRL